MLILIFSVTLTLGVLQGVTGEGCPLLENLLCLGVPPSCAVSQPASITLADNTICPGCDVCTQRSSVPSPHPPPNYPCPPFFCPMMEEDAVAGCDMLSQWVEINGVTCYMCNTWVCDNPVETD